MKAYEAMIELDRFLIRDGELTGEQRAAAVELLLGAKAPVERPQRGEDRQMYPWYYPLPGGPVKQYRSVFNQIPKTKLFAANLYELENLRLLHRLAPQEPQVREMIAGTLERLKSTCFGYQDDGVGECFDVSLVVLRFLAEAAPEERRWIVSRIENFNRHYAEKKRPWYCLWYFWLCLSELPADLAQPETDLYRDTMLNWLGRKGFVMHSEHDTAVHPVLACMLRNNLCRYPEYAHIRGRKPYVSGKDGRLHFDMEP